MVVREAQAVAQELAKRAAKRAANPGSRAKAAEAPRVVARARWEDRQIVRAPVLVARAEPALVALIIVASVASAEAPEGREPAQLPAQLRVQIRAVHRNSFS